MTIRKTLLIAFLLFSTVFATLMTALAYSRARTVLSQEIRRNLEGQALTVMQQVEAMLFERIKDVQEWRRLDLMQEVRVGDIDKRLARFLGDIKSAYAGVYTDIHCAQQARIVSSSDPAQIGRPSVTPTPWMTLALAGGAVTLSRPASQDAQPTMILSSDIADAYGGGPLARLDAYFDWREIARLLEHATAHSGREALLVDRDGALLAASPGLLARVPANGPALPGWHVQARRHGVLRQAAPTLGPDEFMVGYARAARYKGLSDLGWTLLVLTPEDIALAEVDTLLTRLLALLALIVAIAAVLAMRISARTARPLASLTSYAREVARDIDTAPRHIAGSTEVTELSGAFNRMLDELRASRAHLVQASKLAAVGEMAARLAHEVRTPLGIIRSSAQLINRQDKLDARGHEMMSYMINEVDRINALVTGLLENARPRAPEFHVHDLAALARRVVDMIANRLQDGGLVAELVLGDAPVELPCDSDQLTQVLQNLLLNAAQVLPRGGRIRLALEDRGASVLLVVEDDGPGIPPEQRAAVFEPFVSHRAGGIGLGLPVVREIVRLHRGHIAVDASPLGGARFTITLPRGPR